MKWVEVKMKELGVLGNESFKITALMDHLAMITVQSHAHGVFDANSGLIWAEFPEVSHSTVQHCAVQSAPEVRCSRRAEGSTRGLSATMHSTAQYCVVLH